MRLRHFLRLMEAVALFEASKYDPMFAEISTMFPTYREDIASTIHWARQALKREDRIVWFLRWYRLILLNNGRSGLGTTPNGAPDPNATEFVTRLHALFRKYTAQQSKITGKPVDESTLAKYGSPRLIQGNLSHFLSLPVPAIQNLQFTTQTPEELDAQMRQIEQQWKVEQEQKAQHIAPQQGDQILIDFQDGWAWWLLARGSCPLEAKAMGHCGNVPSEHEGDRILSLRKQGPDGWRPSLTFILNGDGKLGEMKGRGNDKPAPQYHPYIIALLENPIIQGLRGGGYMPTHNFQMSDLAPEEQERLMELKPALASGSYLLKKYGPTDEFAARLIEEMETALDGYQEPPTWDPQGKVFVVQQFKDVDDFVDTYGSDFLKRVAGNFNGSGESFFDDIDHGSDPSAAKEIYESLPPEVLQQIGQYAQATYGAEYDEEEYDWTDPDEVWDVLQDQSDGVVDAMNSAVATGVQSGSESEMYDDFVKTLLNGFAGSSDYLEVRYTMYTDEKGKNHISFDAPCRIILTPEEAAKLVDTPGIMDDIANDGWTRDAEIDIDEPHYGWSGYDEEAAKEDAVERLRWDAPGVFPQEAAA